MTTKHYQAVSPDNFPINADGAIYRSRKQALQALKTWIANNFQAQGYYSQTCSNGYRRQIPLNELLDYCDIRTI